MEPGDDVDDPVAAADGADGAEGTEAPERSPEASATADTGDEDAPVIEGGEGVDQPATTVAPAPDVDDPAVGAGWSGVELAVVAALVVIAAALGFAVAWMVRGSRPAPAAVAPAMTPAPPPTAPPPAPSVAPVVVSDEHRDRLVAALIDARDRVGDSGVGDRIVAALQAAGVEVLDPTGDRFDPERHVAAGQDRLTDDPALDGRIADIVSYGYRDRGRLLRLPSVVVWRSRYVPKAVASEVLQ